MAAAGKTPEILFWVGCAGSFDARAQKVTRALCEVLNHAGVAFAILGNEERCTGDPARRAGNEFLFQMTAALNIETLNLYGVKKIVTACPHCEAPLSRILSSFSAGVDLCANAEAWAKIDAGSDAPPATLKNMFGGGLGDLGCGHHHPDGSPVMESCRHRCGSGSRSDG